MDLELELGVLMRVTSLLLGEGVEAEASTHNIPHLVKVGEMLAHVVSDAPMA